MLRFQNSNRKPNGSSGSSVLTLNSAWNSPIHTGLFQAANSSSSSTTTATATTTTTTVNSNTPTTTTPSPAHTTHNSSVKANGMSSPHSCNTSSSATYNNSTTNNDNNNNNNNNNNNSNNSNNLKLIDTLNNTSSSNTSSTNANTTPNMSALYDNYNTTNGGTTTQNIAGSNQSSVTSIKKPFAINGNNNNNNNNNNNTTSLTSSSSMVSSQQPNTFSLNNSSTTNTTSDIGLSSSHSNNNNNTASSSILESIPIPTSPTSTSTTLNTNTIFATPTIPSSTTTTTTTSSTTITTTTATATTPSQSKANSKPRPKTLIEAADKLLSCPNFSQYLSNEQKLSLLWTLHSSSNSIGSSSSSISSTTSSGITPLSPTLASTSTVPFSSHDPTSASSTAQLSIELVPSSSLLSEHVKKQGFNPYIRISIVGTKKISKLIRFLKNRWSKINNGEKQSIISNDLKLLPPKELRSTPTSSSKEKSSNIGFYWSEDNIGNATINQLYSTLQCPSPFVIEYDWAMTELASSLNSSHAVVPEIVSTTTSNATTSSSLLFCNEHSLSSEDAAQASWLTTSTSTSTSISTSTSTATALNTNQSERLPTTSSVSNNQTKHPILPILPEISISKSTLLSTDTTLNQPVHFALTGDYSTDGFTSKIFGGINDSNSNFGHLKPASSQKSNLLFENNESLGFSSIFDSSYDVSLGTLIGTSGSKKSNGGGISGGGVSESLKVNGTASSVKFNHNNNSTNSNSNSSSNNNNSNNNNNNNNDNSNNNNTNNNNNNKNSNNTNNNTNNGTAFSTDHLLGFGENSFDAVFSAEGLLNTDDSTFGLASNIIQSYNKTNTPSPMQTKSPGNHQSPNQVWGPFIQDFSSRTNSKKRSLDEPLNPLNKQIRLSVGNDL